MPTLDSCEYRAIQQYDVDASDDKILEYLNLSNCTAAGEAWWNSHWWYCKFMGGVGYGFWPMYDSQPASDSTEFIFNDVESSLQQYLDRMPNCVIGAQEEDENGYAPYDNSFSCTCNGITEYKNSSYDWGNDNWEEGYCWDGGCESHYSMHQHITCNTCIREPDGTRAYGDVYGKCFNGNPPSWSASEIRILQDDTSNPQYGYCCDATAANYSGELGCSSLDISDIVDVISIDPISGDVGNFKSFIPFPYLSDRLTIPAYYNFEGENQFGRIENKKLQRYHVDEGIGSNNTCPTYGETGITRQSNRDPLGTKGCSCFCK